MKELLIANAVLILGYVFYSSYLTKYGSTEWNRYFLVLWIPISLIVAILPSQLLPSAVPTDFSYSYMLPFVDVSLDSSRTEIGTNWILIGYFVLCGIFFARKLFQLFSVFRIVGRSEEIEFRGVRIHRSHEIEMPFSFFQYVVIPKEIDRSELPIIMEHELAHVRANHSLDIILIQVIQALCWFNPVVWIYENAIRMNHEYEADNAVLQANHDVVGYKELLVSKAMASHVSIGHAIARKSQLHKRFLKMNSSKRNNMWHYGLLIPLIAIAVVGKSCTQEKEQVVSTAQNDKEVSSKQALNGDEVDVAPEFPGGMDELIAYLGATIRYPEQAKKDSVEGRVYIEFIVDENGHVIKPTPLNSVREDIDKEAIRAILEMPKWKPGQNNNQKVKVKMVIPISFKLQ
jgi:TonB family protein